MKRIAGVALLSLLAACGAGQPPAPAAPAQPPPPAPPLAAEGHAEARLEADFTGDGVADVAQVETADGRVLVAGMGGGRGQVPIGRAVLADSPLRPVELGVDAGELVVADTTGGTESISATYRYRYDADARRMRLVAIDAARNGDSPIRLHWDLITGERAVVRGAGGPDRTVQRSDPVWMEDAPVPDDLLDAEIVPEGEDRD